MKQTKLIYTPPVHTSQEKPSTMILLVDDEYYRKYKTTPSIPIAQVVMSFDILKYDTPGHEGNMSTPSDAELQEVFGTKDKMAIAEIMLERGEVHGFAEQENNWEKDMK